MLVIAQNPTLKVFVDTKEIKPVEVPVSVYVQSMGKYFPIINTKTNEIILPDDIEYHTIQGIKFIVKDDTIKFSVNKILEDLKKHPEKNMVDELYAIFREISKWELRIDHFKHANKEEILISARDKPKQSTIYTDYNLYSLKTTNLKYYVVKG